MYDLAASKGRAWLATEFIEGVAIFSPDGRWIAYASNASGRQEICLRALDGSGNAIPVSSGGGIHPRWRRDGRELYFLAG
jgi:Tol biopolymer transport system component